MKIDWKIVAPIAVLVGVIVLYFVRVKPIEGLENANAKIKENLGKVETMNKSMSEYFDTEFKQRDNTEYLDLLKQTRTYAKNSERLGMIMCVERIFEVSDPTNDPEGEKLMKVTQYMSNIASYCDKLMSTISGTDSDLATGSNSGPSAQENEPTSIMGF